MSKNTNQSLPAIFGALEKVRPFYDWTYKIFLFICKVLLTADILITSYAVLGRLIGKYIPIFTDPAWSEQVVLTLMSYMAVLSAALAIRRKAHIRMTAFDNYLPKKAIKVLDLIACIAVLALGIIMVVAGFNYCMRVRRFKYESMTWLSRFWMYFPVPLAGIAMIVFELEQIVNCIKEFFIKDEVKEAK